MQETNEAIVARGERLVDALKKRRGVILEPTCQGANKTAAY